MTDSTAPLPQGPVPHGLGREISTTEVETAPRVWTLGRHRGVGIAFSVVGVLLAALVAPNLTDERRSFAFEKPPDPLTFGFNPQVFVSVVGYIWIAVGVLSFVPQLRRAVTALQATSAILAMPLLVAIGLALSGTPTTNVVNLLSESLVLATPLMLGSMTGLWCERSGIVNIGIEGQMLAAAGVGYMAYAVLGDAKGGWWLVFGILIAILTGTAMALIHAVLSIRFQINQIVAGVVINLVALGLTGFLRSQVIVPSGFANGTSTSDIGIPQLSHLPIVGEPFFQLGPLQLAAYLIVVATWLLLYHTPWGLRIRASGEDPHAAETVGVNVVRLRYQAVLVGGVIAGVAGAWFAMEQGSGFEDNMTNSAGFIALAALIVGKWTPWGAFGGALLFGFSRALGVRLQFLKVEVGGFAIPSEFFQSLPFLVTIVVVAGALGRAIAPAAEGQPYSPSK